MTGGDGDDGTAEDRPTRRRLLRATGGAAVAGVGLGLLTAGAGPAEDRGDNGRPDVVAFCGPDAVCASSGGAVLVADPEGDEWSFRRVSKPDGFCHVADTGTVVAVEVDGERFHNPGSELDGAVVDEGPAVAGTRDDGRPVV